VEVKKTTNRSPKRDEPVIQEYLAIWKMDISADSPEQAARLARAYQRDPKAIVGVFEVYDQEGGAHRVDLDEVDGVGVG
jgi:hypothetical protein